MAAIAGIVKSVSSDVIAIDKHDKVRGLNVNDEVYIGETIKGESESATITITANDGKDISLSGYDTLWLDHGVVSDEKISESIDTDGLFRALLGEDYAAILDRMNEKVDDMFATAKAEQKDSDESASLADSSNLENKNVSQNDLLTENELKIGSSEPVSQSFDSANFDATTIYIEIDNDLNKLS